MLKNNFTRRSILAASRVRVDLTRNISHYSKLKLGEICNFNRNIFFSPLELCHYFSTFSEINEEFQHTDDEISSLEQLLRVKPAISEDDGSDEADFDGVPDDDIEGDQSDPRHKLGKILLKLSRVYYRHGEQYPEWFVAKQKEICNNRSPSQIRRCLKNWMIKNDRDMHQKYRTKPLLWGELLPNESVPPVVYEYGPEETAAYSFYFMPSRYQILTRLFKELRTLSPTFTPRRIIDFGCGPATGAASAYSAWGSIPNALQKYVGVEMSQSMIDAAKIMTQGPLAIPDCVFWNKSSEVVKRAANNDERYDLAIVTYTLNELANDPSRRAAIQLLFELLDVGGYLVVLEAGNPHGSHSARTARQFVLDVFNNVDRKGQFTATPIYPTSNTAKDEDDEEDEYSDPSKEKVKRSKKPQATSSMILPPPKGHHYDQLGAFVVAPCTHDKKCPLDNKTWCSFSQKVFSGMIRKASEEKFSYVVIQKRPKPTSSISSNAKKPNTASKASKTSSIPPQFGLWTNAPIVTESGGLGLSSPFEPTVDPTPIKVLQRFMQTDDDQQRMLLDTLMDEVDWAAYNPPLYRSEWSRILRSPLKGRGHVTMDMCNPAGKIERTVISRSDLDSVPALFIALRKSTWGGLFPALSQQREEDLGLGYSSIDTMESPLAIKQKTTRARQPLMLKQQPELKHQHPTKRENVKERRPSRGSNVIEDVGDNSDDDEMVVIDESSRGKQMGRQRGGASDQMSNEMMQLLNQNSTSSSRRGVRDTGSSGSSSRRGKLAEDFSEEDMQQLLRSLNLMGSGGDEGGDDNGRPSDKRVGRMRPSYRSGKSGSKDSGELLGFDGGGETDSGRRSDGGGSDDELGLGQDSGGSSTTSGRSGGRRRPRPVGVSRHPVGARQRTDSEDDV